MNFAGPNARLDSRLNDDGTSEEWSKPAERVDLTTYHHNLEYAAHSDTATRNTAKLMMLNELDSASNPTMREKTEWAIIRPIIKTKARFRQGVKPGNFRKAAFNRGE